MILWSTAWACVLQQNYLSFCSRKFPICYDQDHFSVWTLQNTCLLWPSFRHKLFGIVNNFSDFLVYSKLQVIKEKVTTHQSAVNLLSLNRKLMSSLTSSSLQHLTSISGTHSFSETMDFISLPFLRLICHPHDLTSLLSYKIIKMRKCPHRKTKIIPVNVNKCQRHKFRLTSHTA